jgi:outer membrane protein assembly factor BamA
MLPLREGDIADGEVLGKWLVDDLGKIYRDLGYFSFYADDGREFRVDPQSGADVVDYNIKIEERAQYKVQAIKFAGKSSISRDRLIRVMSLHEGEVFSRKQLDDSIDELNKLGVTLDKYKDVSVVEDRARDRVTVKIILDEQGRANESFDRSTSKRSWYP